MAANVLKRLGPTTLTATAATLGSYTVGSGRIFLVRSIHAIAITTGAPWFTLSIGTDATGTRWEMEFPVTKGSPYDWSGFKPLAATEFLQALASATASVNLTVSGVEMDVPT